VQLLLAIVLDDMASNLEDSVKRSITRTRVAYEKAYDLLVPDEVSGISAASWQMLVNFLRPEWVKSGVSEMLFTYVDSFDEEAQSHDINHEEFRHAMLYFKYEIKVSKKQYKALHSAYIEEVQAMLEAAAAAGGKQQDDPLASMAEGDETLSGQQPASNPTEAIKAAPAPQVSSSVHTQQRNRPSLEPISSSVLQQRGLGEGESKACVGGAIAGDQETHATDRQDLHGSSSPSSLQGESASRFAAVQILPHGDSGEGGQQVMPPAIAAPSEVRSASATSSRPGSASGTNRPGSATSSRSATPAAPGAAALHLPSSSARGMDESNVAQGDGDDLFEEDPILCGMCSDNACLAKCCGLSPAFRDEFRTRITAVADSLKRFLGFRYKGWGVAELVFNIMVAINLGCVITNIVLEADGVPRSDSRVQLFIGLQYCFLFLFILEVSLKITAYGMDEFWRRSVSNQLDVVLLLASIVAELVLLVNRTTGVIDNAVSGSNTAAVVSVSRVFRLLRLLRALRAFRKVFATIGQMVPVLTGVFSVLILMFYSFAMVGIDIWGGQIDRVDMEANHPDNLYVTAAYWGLNFDTLPRAMMCCLTFVVVNNFFVLLDGLAVSTSLTVAWLYFGIFYVSVVLIAVNVLVAIIFQAFVFKYRHDDGLVLTGSEKQQFIKVAADGTPYRTRDEMTLSSLDSATLIMARDLEWFNFERFQRKARVQQKLNLRQLEMETTAATMEATGLDDGLSDEDVRWADVEYDTMLAASKALPPPPDGPRRRGSAFFGALGLPWGSSYDSSAGVDVDVVADHERSPEPGPSHAQLSHGNHLQPPQRSRQASSVPRRSAVLTGSTSRRGSDRGRGSFMAAVVGSDVDPYRREEIADGIVHALAGGAGLRRQEAHTAHAGFGLPGVPLHSAQSSTFAPPVVHAKTTRAQTSFKSRLQAYRAQRMLAADVADSLARQASSNSNNTASGMSEAAVSGAVSRGMVASLSQNGRKPDAASDASLQRLGAAVAAAQLLGRRAIALREASRLAEAAAVRAEESNDISDAGGSTHARRRWSTLPVRQQFVPNSSGAWSVAVAALAARGKTSNEDTAQ
jgi:hypothetical protein